MEPMTVDMPLLARLAFERLMANFVKQTDAGYKGQRPPELVLQVDPKDEIPYVLLMRVGVWMTYSRYLHGTFEAFQGTIGVEVDGASYQIAVEADTRTIKLKRLAVGTR